VVCDTPKVGQCLASVTAGNGFALLVWCQLAGPAHMNASGLRPGPAFARALVGRPGSSA
jgi:hypothetical protein